MSHKEINRALDELLEVQNIVLEYLKSEIYAEEGMEKIVSIFTRGIKK